ncbi:MAG: serpin family protein, partial [Acutalibacteraceae bacterium]
VDDYLNDLTAEKLSNLLDKNTAETAHITIPAFKNSSELSLNKSLQTMGMKAAFDSEAADFSKIGNSLNGNIFIDSVMQNTEITVDELGTKASAATKVDMMEGAALIENSVICNRPFIYFIFESETKMPLFAGAFMSAS